MFHIQCKINPGQVNEKITDNSKSYTNFILRKEANVINLHNVINTSMLPYRM